MQFIICQLYLNLLKGKTQCPTSFCNRQSDFFLISTLTSPVIPVGAWVSILCVLIACCAHQNMSNHLVIICSHLSLLIRVKLLKFTDQILCLSYRCSMDGEWMNNQWPWHWNRMLSREQINKKRKMDYHSLLAASRVKGLNDVWLC